MVVLCLKIILAAWINILVIGETVKITRVRLAGTTSKNSGRVEVEIGGAWGTVCDDSWDNLDASVVCRMLGYNGGGTAYSKAKFGVGTGPIHLDDVGCKGTESSLDQCQINTAKINCMHTEDAGVECDVTKQTPPPSISTTTKGVEPVPDRCPSGQQNPNIRLVNSNGKQGMGYVEVRDPTNRWGSMCDDMMDDNVAKVICGSLCYDVASARPGAVIRDIGKPRLPIILDDVKCNGQEKDIRDCTHLPWGQSNCDDKNEVASVTCVSLQPEPLTPPSPVLQCGNSTLTAFFSKTRDPNLEPKHLTIANIQSGTCTGLRKESNTEFVIIRIPFEECGMVVKSNRTHIIYSNVIKYDYTHVEGSITRVNVYMVEVSCEMPRNYTADRPMQPLTETVTKKAEGRFVVTMNFYLNNSFSVAEQVLPLRISVGEWLNVAMVLESSDSRLKLVIPNCVATPSTDRNDRVSFPLFRDKCAVEETLGFFPLTKYKFGFRYQTFAFVNYPMLYIHCESYICMATETTVECDRSCIKNKTASSGRRRRDVSADFIHSSQWVGSGPVYVYKSEDDTLVDGHIVKLSTTPFTTTVASKEEPGSTDRLTTARLTSSLRSESTTIQRHTTAARDTATIHSASPSTHFYPASTQNHTPQYTTESTARTSELKSQSSRPTTTVSQSTASNIQSPVQSDATENRQIPPSKSVFNNPLSGLSIKSVGLRVNASVLLIFVVSLLNNLISIY